MSVPPPGAPGPSPASPGPPPPASGVRTEEGKEGERRRNRRAKRGVLLRSFLIQGSWNYRTMLGGGFAFALLPYLERLHRGNPERLADGVRRHAEHFNAHPYLAPIALGAVARMEEDGDSPEQIQRFKMAVRGPLGGLGDSLVWANWLPVTLLLALVLAAAGARPAIAITVFLVLFNIGHVLLRIWGFRMGFRKGRYVGDGIRSANFARQINRLSAIGALLLGVLVGLLVMLGPGMGPAAGPWLLASVLTFLLGYIYGQRFRRAESYVFMLVISVLFLIGTIS